MISPWIRRTTTMICLVLSLSACKMPASNLPTLPSQNVAVTAAAKTIAAQLTAIVDPLPQATGETSPVPGATTLSVLPPTETLPSTSTPLPTNTPAPSDTPISTATVQPSPQLTQTVISPRASLGDPTWTDSFQDGSNWPLYDDSHVQMEIEGGKLHMTALIPNRQNPWDGWMVSQPHLTNFYLVVTTTTGECSGMDRYGLLARAAPDASRSYLFGFSCDGKYSLRIWNGLNFKMLVDWTASPFIYSGGEQTNQLGFRAEGNKLSLFANDNLLTELEDESFNEGAFGLFVGAVDTAGFSVQFDDVSYWDLP